MVFAFASCWMTVFGATTESTPHILLAPALAAVRASLARPPRGNGTSVGCYVFWLRLANAGFRSADAFTPMGPTGGWVGVFGYLVVRCVMWIGAMTQRRNDRTHWVTASRRMVVASAVTP